MQFIVKEYCRVSIYRVDYRIKIEADEVAQWVGVPSFTT